MFQTVCPRISHNIPTFIIQSEFITHDFFDPRKHIHNTHMRRHSTWSSDNPLIYYSNMRGTLFVIWKMFYFGWLNLLQIHRSLCRILLMSKICFMERLKVHFERSEEMCEKSIPVVYNSGGYILCTVYQCENIGRYTALFILRVTTLSRPKWRT